MGLTNETKGKQKGLRAGVATRKGEATVVEKFRAKKRAWARRPKIIENRHDIYLGDARSPNPLPGDNTVHLVVTSPPYWNLKRYHHDRRGAQLGHIDGRQDFLSELEKVWSHCYRMLVPGGRLCVVVGDVCRSRKANGRHVVEPLHSYIQVQCQELGFDPLAPIIWHKIANVATEARGKGSTFLGKPYEPNAVIKNDIEYILFLRKPGGYRSPTQTQRHLSVIDKADHRVWFQQVWSDLPGKAQRGHPAPFPAELARRLIGMFSFVGDTVFDPFWGTGNTTLAAIEMYRSSIGIEIEPQYLCLGEEQFRDVPPETTIRFHGEWAAVGGK